MIDIHRSEEEQVEALKNWWKENGTAVITGIVIGVAVIVGVRYWWTYQERQAQESSQIYSELLQSKNLGNSQQLQDQAGVLKENFESTPYASFAAFILAESAIKQGKTDAALAEYRWALDHAPHPALEHLARVRMARLLVDDGQYDKADELIRDQNQVAFIAQYEELRGDIYKAKGELEKADSAYREALAAASGQHRQMIEMKMHTLAQASATEAESTN